MKFKNTYRFCAPIFWGILCVSFIVGQTSYAGPKALPITMETIQQRLKILDELETELNLQWKQIEQKGLTPSTLIENMGTELQSLSAEETALLSSGKNKEINQAIADGKFSKIVGGIRQAEGEYISFQKRMDSYSQIKTDLIMDYWMLSAYETVDALENKLTGIQSRIEIERKKPFIARLKKAITAMEVAHTKYQGEREKFGTNEDRPRRLAFRAFKAAFDNVADIAGSELRTMTETLDHSVSAHRNLLKIAPMALKLPEVIAAAQKREPVLPHLAKAYVDVTHEFGLEFEAPNLTPALSKDPGVINIVLMEHENELLYGATVANTGVEKTATLTTLLGLLAKFHLPASSLELFEQVPDLVIVGGNRNPISAMETRINDHNIKTFLILPTGALPNEMEGLPAPEQFSKLLELLARKGHKLNIISVAMPDHAQIGTTFGSLGLPMDAPTLRHFVQKPIPPDLVKLLFASQSSKGFLWNLTRQGWLEVKKDIWRERFFGVPEPIPHLKSLGTALQSRMNCHRLFQNLKFPAIPVGPIQASGGGAQ